MLAEEFTLRENRRVKTALVMAGLSTTKTLAGFDVAFQPSLDKNRIMALAELKFIDRAEVLHLVGPPELDSYCPSRYPVIVPALLAADRRTPDAGSGALVRPVCLGALQINEDHA